MAPGALLTCEICFDNKSDIPNDYFVLTKCDGVGGHVFHQTCIAEWNTQSRSCPVCKNPVDLENMSRLYGCDPKNRVVAIKIAVLGDSGVGKTCLIKRFETGVSNLNATATVGCDQYTREIRVDNQIVKLTIWDPSGQERYNCVIPQCVRDCHGIIFCYDKIHFESLSNVCRIWMVFAANHVLNKECASVLLECRNDLTTCASDFCKGSPTCRPVTQVEKTTAISLLKTNWFSTSVVNSSVNELEAPFRNLVRRILANDALMEQIERTQADTFQVQEGDGKGGESFCDKITNLFKWVAGFFFRV